MIFTKKASKKETVIFSVVVFLLLALLFTLSAIPVVNPGIWQLISIFHFAFSTNLLVKFYLCEYTYTLTDTEFYIDRKTGEKTQRVCHIDNFTIVAVHDKSDWKKHKKSRQISSVYNYTTSILPARFYAVVFEMNSKKTAVLAELCEEQLEKITCLIRDREESL